jgi:hypothetical protein
MGFRARGTNRILYIEYIQSDLKGLKERRGMLLILPRVGRYLPERNVLYSTFQVIIPTSVEDDDRCHPSHLSTLSTWNGMSDFK